MSTRPAATERHLAILDELTELGMVLARRVVNLPPRPGQDTARDFDIITRAVRRPILLSHVADGKLPTPAAPRPERDPAAPPAAPSGRHRSEAGTRLDSLDRLDDISAPFEHVVAEIIDDIRAVLASTHEADIADLD